MEISSVLSATALSGVSSFSSFSIEPLVRPRSEEILVRSSCALSVNAFNSSGSCSRRFTGGADGFLPNRAMVLSPYRLRRLEREGWGANPRPAATVLQHGRGALERQ